MKYSHVAVLTSKDASSFFDCSGNHCSPEASAAAVSSPPSDINSNRMPSLRERLKMFEGGGDAGATTSVAAEHRSSPRVKPRGHAPPLEDIAEDGAL